MVVLKHLDPEFERTTYGFCTLPLHIEPQLWHNKYHRLTTVFTRVRIVWLLSIPENKTVKPWMKGIKLNQWKQPKELPKISSGKCFKNQKNHWHSLSSKKNYHKGSVLCKISTSSMEFFVSFTISEYFFVPSYQLSPICIANAVKSNILWLIQITNIYHSRFYQDNEYN